jgi:hypothetical protein
MTERKKPRAKLWKLHVRTYEIDDDGNSRAVVEHIFFGKTKAEAERYAAAHEKTDVFFKHCGAGALALIEGRTKLWRGIKCWAEWWWEEA